MKKGALWIVMNVNVYMSSTYFYKANMNKKSEISKGLYKCGVCNFVRGCAGDSVSIFLYEISLIINREKYKNNC